MERNIVVYFGMGYLPDYNAVACREQALGFIAKEAGYIPVLIGVSDNVPFGEFEKSNYNTIDCYSIKYAKSIMEKLKDTCVIGKTLIHILEDIGVDRIKCFIMQDYQLGPMKQLERYCSTKGIAYVADIMDWFTPSRDYSISKNLTKTIDTYLRMYFFYPSLKNKIYISHKFKQYFQDNEEKNILVLPCTCKDVPYSSGYKKNANSNITITFAGFLGAKCEKEKIDWIIRALYENESRINLNVIGLSKEDIVLRVPRLAEYITEHIHFWGYIPRQECINVLQKSHFSIVARKSNKLTEYGFSSKICEAFAYGIPVIATNNSDNGIYIRHGVNGYVCNANYESLKELLADIEKKSPDSILEMQRHLVSHNPLSVSKFIDKFSSFIDNLNI